MYNETARIATYDPPPWMRFAKWYEMIIRNRKELVSKEENKLEKSIKKRPNDQHDSNFIHE